MLRRCLAGVVGNFGSTDKTTVFTPNAGHFPMFELSVPLFRGAISDWLNSSFPAGSR
jgi:hypothetical protein